MSAVALATKVCRTCGEDKPLSEFHRKRSRPDGRQDECKVCLTGRVAAAQARQRAEMGEEAWAEHRRRITARSRERTGNASGKKYAAAYRAAQSALVDRHRAEFDHLLLLARRGELPGQAEATA